MKKYKNHRQQKLNTQENKDQLIHFKIDHLDPLGQGVFKINQSIFFIPKTLPGEEGIARVIKKKKGVSFAQVVELHTSSPKRISPKCPHFNECGGCQYLHMSYEEELLIKVASLKKHLGFLGEHFRHNPLPEIQLISAPQRDGYRNRVTLHFQNNSFGYYLEENFNSYPGKKITPLKQCLLATPQIQEYINQLHGQKFFLNDHDSILITNDGVNLNQDNTPEFSQVNDRINEDLQELVAKVTQEFIKNYAAKECYILDLFSGNGNLTLKLEEQLEKISVDYSDYHFKNYLRINLFQNQALSQLLESLTFQQISQNHQLALLILDPPRSGFEDLWKWVEELHPPAILYVSCNPSTLIRDLKKISNYSISQIFLLDMFPSTSHYETVIFLQKNKDLSMIEERE
jgi:23S rRNA (uracil1939-C5)-methyltransferase